MGKKYFDELNIFRALIIIWVTIGHSFNAGHSIDGVLHAYAYTFHMMAFFTLSGLLFRPKLSRISNHVEALKTAGNRFMRLIVPYLFYSAVSYLLKFLFEKYAYNKLPSNIFVNLVLGINNPNGGLWFLHALFVLSIIAIILRKIPSFALTVLFLTAKIVTMFVPVQIPIVDYVLIYGFYFFAGICLYDYYDGLSANIKALYKNKTALFYCVLIVLFALSVVIEIMMSGNQLPPEPFGFAISVINIVVWYLISIIFDSSKHYKKVLVTVGDYGMDIYMLGYYVQIALRVVLGSILGVSYTIYSVLMMVLGLIVPIPVSKYIIRKFRITRLLMLGDYSKKE